MGHQLVQRLSQKGRSNPFVSQGQFKGSLKSGKMSSEHELKIFSGTILGEVKRPQIHCLSPEGEFLICGEANCRMVEKIF